MFLVPLLFLLAIFWLFFIMMRPDMNSSQRSQQSYPANRPLEILKERYARGEISEEEYQKIKRNLE